eukprot:2249781-Rhodomonas_salina.1
MNNTISPFSYETWQLDRAPGSIATAFNSASECKAGLEVTLPPGMHSYPGTRVQCGCHVQVESVQVTQAGYPGTRVPAYYYYY